MMSIQNRINWKKSDYITLGKAVSQFNKKINELNAEERKLYLPETIKYKDIKSNIFTRKELNRIISSLKRFSKEGAEELYTTKAGQELTKWEYNELKNQSKIAKARLSTELKDLATVKNEQGFTRLEMGSLRAREIQAQIRNLENLENKKGYEFNRLRERIQNIGTQDYIMKKSVIFQENYLKEMEKYKGFNNYEKLMEKLKSIKNPISFFNYVSKNELIQDLTYQSDQYYSQQEFNYFVSQFRNY